MKALKFLVALLAILSSCAYHDTTESVSCNSVEISFSKEVMPIITASCATNSRCHAAGSSEGPGALTNYAQVYAARTDIQSSVRSGRMPEGSSLSSVEKSTIVCWIQNGALDN